jgi:hypothetical protein
MTQAVRVGVQLGRTTEGRKLLWSLLPSRPANWRRKLAKSVALAILPTLERWGNRGAEWIVNRVHRCPRCRLRWMERAVFIGFGVVGVVCGKLRRWLAPLPDPAISRQWFRQVLNNRTGFSAHVN